MQGAACNIDIGMIPACVRYDSPICNPTSPLSDVWSFSWLLMEPAAKSRGTSSIISLAMNVGYPDWR